ncbi:MAG: hypothetical protein JWR51_45 [Devosia sp.]|uniref:sulfotransferase family protein n=1 Tax=Devosia sp. TaxID=1871048 RepID=UPI002605DEED|nr:sulfotransferase family protein [Devosia sp.]MDB5526942.1 hypothetical protein [Devosia sp.]
MSTPASEEPASTGAKVYCIGLSRTGTTSICQALEVLGYRTLHFSMELFVQPELISPELHYEPMAPLGASWRWERQNVVNIIRARVDPDIFDKYDAMGDVPIPLFYRELDRKFPGSKFIHTVRDEARWLKSMKWMYEEGSVLWKHGVLDDELKYQTYGTMTYDPDLMLKAYRAHNAEVTEYFKDRPQDLLHFDLSSAPPNYEQLCLFLGKPLPTTPFPVSNESRTASWIAKLVHRVGTLPFYGTVARSVLSLIRMR